LNPTRCPKFDLSCERRESLWCEKNPNPGFSSTTKETHHATVHKDLSLQSRSACAAADAAAAVWPVYQEHPQAHAPRDSAPAPRRQKHARARPRRGASPCSLPLCVLSAWCARHGTGTTFTKISTCGHRTDGSHLCPNQTTPSHSPARRTVGRQTRPLPCPLDSLGPKCAHCVAVQV
jgi:hypothetical protein